MLAVTLLVVQAASRRTAALIGLALLTFGTPRAGGAQQARRPRSPAERAWDRRDLAQARDAYVAEIPRRGQDDTAWYNAGSAALAAGDARSEEHTSELQSRLHLVCRLLLEKKKRHPAA